jgi:hypothetical protein
MFASNLRFVSTILVRVAYVVGGIGAVMASIWIGNVAYNRYRKISDETNIAVLNQKVILYQEEVGTLPDANLIDLYHKGLTQKRLHRTPFGGYYRLNPSQSVVYNPHLSSR